MIRLGTLQDIPLILRMAEDFYKSSRYADVLPFSPEKVEGLARSLVEGPKAEGVTLVSLGQNNEPTGLLGASRGILPLFEGTIGVELILWVEPEHRKGRSFIDLLDAYLYWCRDIARVDFIQLNTLEDNPKLERVYEKKGFQKVESAYVRKTWPL